LYVFDLQDFIDCKTLKGS